MSKVYSYLIQHDLGLAPNPFGAYCTLAVCKPQIRRSGNLRIGDWVLGTGSKALETYSGKIFRKKLIYAMQVSEIISLEKYWDDSRFQYKKPVLNGSLAVMYGDNFYHKDKQGKWIQEDSAHSYHDGSVNRKHLKIDTGGRNVLISNDFYYFGEEAIAIPKQFHDVCHSTIGHKIVPAKVGGEFIQWLTKTQLKGIHGDPINWMEYRQQTLF